jgi:hypothetical protein
MATESSESAATIHAWQDADAQGWESCERCSQRRRRVERGWIVRVYSEGRERQVMVLDSERDTPCSMAVRFK